MNVVSDRNEDVEKDTELDATRQERNDDIRKRRATGKLVLGFRE